MCNSREVTDLYAKATEVKNNFGKYLKLAAGQEVTITRNGKPVARLISIEKEAGFLVDKLRGIIPKETDEAALLAERRAAL
jgi:prevent-host-death family protein